MTTRAYLGLGSNVGDRLGNLLAAIEALRERGLRPLRSSRVYETEPVGGPPQPDFLNAVVEVATELEPREALAACRAVEDELGRERAERWGPRTIDVDILTFGERTVDEPGLTIPHPRAHERGFVLAPLLELDPSPRLAGGPDARGLRTTPGTFDGVRPFAPPLLD